MARIRTIKPETPQSESLSRVSRDARLTFMLLITQCDDHGRFIAHPRALASSLFPYDEDAATLIGVWLAELEREDCIRRYTVKGSSYLFLPGWSEHQRIDNAGKAKYPPPPENMGPVPRGETPQEQNPRAEIRGEPPRAAETLRDPPLDQGREGTKDQGGEGSASAQAREDHSDEMLEAWQRELGGKLGNPRKLTPERRATLNRRFGDTFEGDPAKWADFLRRIKASPFLTGENDRGWKADFDWVLTPKHALQILEGKYDRARAGNGSAPDFTPHSEREANQWRGNLKGFLEHDIWLPQMGPKPGEPGCRVPPPILAEFAEQLRAKARAGPTLFPRAVA